MTRIIYEVVCVTKRNAEKQITECFRGDKFHTPGEAREQRKKDRKQYPESEWAIIEVRQREL